MKKFYETPHLRVFLPETNDVIVKSQQGSIQVSDEGPSEKVDWGD